MACTNPLKGFQDGLTKNGKPNFIITNYAVNHIEVEKNGNYTKCYTSHIGSNCQRSISSFIDIPCGKCDSCKLEHSRMWTDRILLEMSKFDDNCFITLTYDDEHLPLNKKKIFDEITGEYIDTVEGCYNSLNKKDLQLFFKRLRKNTGAKIRYFACGEYGSESKRCHFHAILFGWKPNDLKKYCLTELGDVLYNSDTIDKAWQHKGYCVIGEATAESAGYVARYTVKKLFSNDNNFYVENGIEKEFITMSRKPGIGKEWFDEHINDLYKYEHIIVPSAKGGRLAKVPRYFDKKYEEMFPDKFLDLKKIREENAKEHKKIMVANSDKSYEEILKDKAINIEARTKILKERRKV